MSDDEGSGSESGSGLTVWYRCRHCPGQQFTAAERDIHRRIHRRGRQRGGSPPLTLFEPISVADERSPNAPRPRILTGRRPIGRAAAKSKGRKPFGGADEPAIGRNRPEPGKRPITSNKNLPKVKHTRQDGG